MRNVKDFVKQLTFGGAVKSMHEDDVNWVDNFVNQWEASLATYSNNPHTEFMDEGLTLTKWTDKAVVTKIYA